jgi:uncharacterized membrane protein (DUF485 family)
MPDDLVARVQANPRYRELVAKRTRFGWILAAGMFAVYYGYVSLIAFDKDLLARPVGGGVMSLGIPIGFGVIVFTIAVTALYVWRANTEFDALTRRIVEEAGE